MIRRLQVAQLLAVLDSVGRQGGRVSGWEGGREGKEKMRFLNTLGENTTDNITICH